ncbi:MAG: PEP-CTERM sorting domain-containing protein, partial [Opitutaceae bacterium]|nr:PEP-CTERM sorting domain-containing protein [Opitutaceae bacterium]
AAANIVRGGAFGSSDSGLATSARSTILANVENYYMGFRVVAASLAAVPEPSTWAVATGLITLVMGLWLRRGRRAGRG